MFVTIYSCHKYDVTAICSHCGVDLFELMLAGLVNLFGPIKTDAVQKAIDFVMILMGLGRFRKDRV